MAIRFHPGYGTILYCDFSHHVKPEIIKTRPVVVVSRSHSELCTVVPLSGTEPIKMNGWHHKMTIAKLPVFLQKNDWWAKCDCMTTVAFFRLDRCKAGKCPTTGKRLFEAPKLYSEDLKSIKNAILSHLAMSLLISS